MKELKRRTGLILARFFPPRGGGGTQRIHTLCKHAADCGWNLTVLTDRLPRSDSKWAPIDTSLSDELPFKGVKVVRVDADIDDYTHATIGRWQRAYINAAAAELSQQAIDAVLVSMSPFHLARVGRSISAQWGVPVVYDLRDPWALDGWHEYRTRATWKQDFAEMSETLRSADGVIFNTHEAMVAAHQSIQGLDNVHTVVITNGYDEGDFRTAETPPRAQTRRLTIVHSGTFFTHRLPRYQSIRQRVASVRHYSPENFDSSGRTPLHLFRAIVRTLEERHLSRDELRVRLIGRPDQATLRCVRDHQLEGIVEAAGFVNHSESMEEIAHADILFLPLEGRQEGRSRVIPGKTYEYIRSGTPIIACLPEGEAKEIVSESGLGVMARPNDSIEIARALLTQATRLRNGYYEGWTFPDSLRRYERKVIGSRILEFLYSVRVTTSGRAPCA